MIHTTLTTLVDRLEAAASSETHIIRWGSPVPSFGNLSHARVATVGINPSNREFVDQSGNELEGAFRRFETLNSLGIDSWADADARHLAAIIECCCNYFARNPYDTWFRTLETVISAIGESFYGPDAGACHVDLVPYATEKKWTALSARQRSLLLRLSGDSLPRLLRDSGVSLLLLNGQTVVDTFQKCCGVSLRRQRMPAWSLLRDSGVDVGGVAYIGRVDHICDVPLARTILVLGYNHNLQSSYGVTKRIICRIRDWVADAACRVSE